jgi:tetratricopeptide (TPR) repeat protein
LILEEVKFALRQQAAAALRAGRFEDAAGSLDRLREVDPLALETRCLDLELLVRTGKLAEADSAARQLLDLHPGSARVLYWAGRLAFDRKDYSAAASRFEECLRIHPNPFTRRQLAKSLTNLGRFEEAERHLLVLVPGDPECRLDLAWLHERRGEPARALEEVEALLAARPGHKAASKSRLRLRARLADAADLVEETETLLDLGEEPAPEVIPSYIEALLRGGEGARAREFIARRKAGFEPRLALQVAWVSYKLLAYDVAMDLFLQAFPAVTRSGPFYSALEKAAEKTRRVGDLLAVYRAHAPADRSLHGRIKKVAKRGPAEE